MFENLAFVLQRLYKMATKQASMTKLGAFLASFEQSLEKKPTKYEAFLAQFQLLPAVKVEEPETVYSTYAIDVHIVTPTDAPDHTFPQ